MFWELFFALNLLLSTGWRILATSAPSLLMYDCSICCKLSNDDFKKYMGAKLSLHSGTMVNTALIKGIKMLLNEKIRVEPGG